MSEQNATILFSLKLSKSLTEVFFLGIVTHKECNTTVTVRSVHSTQGYVGCAQNYTHNMKGGEKKSI